MRTKLILTLALSIGTASLALAEGFFSATMTLDRATIKARYSYYNDTNYAQTLCPQDLRLEIINMAVSDEKYTLDLPSLYDNSPCTLVSPGEKIFLAATDLAVPQDIQEKLTPKLYVARPIGLDIKSTTWIDGEAVKFSRNQGSAQCLLNVRK